MSKFTAEQVEKKARHLANASCFECSGAEEMLLDLARRLRQEEEENRRDPATEPKTGDSVVFVDPFIRDRIFVSPSTRVVQEVDSWSKLCKSHGATIIRCREVP